MKTQKAMKSHDGMRSCNSVRLEHDLRMVETKLEATQGDT